MGQTFERWRSRLRPSERHEAEMALNRGNERSALIVVCGIMAYSIFELTQKMDTYLDGDTPGKTEGVRQEPSKDTTGSTSPEKISGTWDPLAEMEETESSDESHYLRRERHVGKFKRVITLDHPVDNGGMKTEIEDGIVTITIPKLTSRT